MRIVRSNLCLRFYTRDGWTRHEVAQLLHGSKDHARVIPRYYDERDTISKACGYRLDDGLDHPNCEYFAVYGEMHPFDPHELQKHEIV